MGYFDSRGPDVRMCTDVRRQDGALTSVRRVMKMKAPAESGQASWSQISRTWLKHVATSTADELCLAWGSGSSYATKHTGKKTSSVKCHSEGPRTTQVRRDCAPLI